MSKSEKNDLIMKGAGIVTIVVIYALGCRKIDKIYERKLDEVFGLMDKDK